VEVLVDLLGVLALAAGVLLVADFISGLFHWLEDSYGDPSWPLVGRLVTQANIIHHFEPRHMTYHSWLSSARGPMAGAAVLLAVAYLAQVPIWPVFLLAIVLGNANEIHKWAHRSRKENGRLITSLQRVGLLQSRRQHAKHHQARKDSHYCVVTNYLNPVLEGVRFWSFLEAAIYLLLRVRRRVDPSIGPGRHEYALPPCSDPRCRWRQRGTARSEAA
jgi:hypothetical protein